MFYLRVKLVCVGGVHAASWVPNTGTWSVTHSPPSLRKLFFSPENPSYMVDSRLSGTWYCVCCHRIVNSILKSFTVTVVVNVSPNPLCLLLDFFFP